MFIHHSLTDYLQRRAAAWRRRRTERYISSLPPEIQKDIGWPSGNRTSSRSAPRVITPELEPTWQPR
ncbi:hypothetical protein [Chelativorans sp.]|uniref:hypothetical protein n=1 Tax=Chelativorans sp. TaxID=2203393 RepID=UPI002810F9EC|nr:hypothetical protein [Chelativorans sp.]